MNERLTIQDLTDLLAAKHSMTKKDAEAFVKEFFLLIEQALENEKTVKIKGLGTFKLIDVDSRESVNVNTGERFQIKGHTKVSFSPDANLRDTINKPFAHFETVVLNENTILEDTPIEDTEEEEAGEEASAQTVLNEIGENTRLNAIERTDRLICFRHLRSHCHPLSVESAKQGDASKRIILADVIFHHPAIWSCFQKFAASVHIGCGTIGRRIVKVVFLLKEA